MPPKTPLYLDYHATTPCDPEVVDEMLRFLGPKAHFGNASSRTHAFGWAAEKAVDIARERVAAAIGASPREILFTSGATESNNLAIKGAALNYAEKGRPMRKGRGGARGKHVITQAIEHKAVLDSCDWLAARGYEVTVLPVDTNGQVDPDAVRDAIRDETVLVSVMFANNEVGAVQPIAKIGSICRENDVLFHCDAVQGIGRLPFDVSALEIDLVSLSAHKIYGPKGIGALYIRRGRPRIKLQALQHGGSQERGMRAGTLPVSQIAGFGKAAELAHADLAAGATEALRELRDRLYNGLVENTPHLHLNGSLSARLPHNLNVSFACVEAEALMMATREVAVSTGSACSSASLEPSYVLRAMGVPDALAHCSIRFGLGRWTTEEEIDFTIDLFGRKVAELRALSPLYALTEEGVDLGSEQWTAG
jgi:cysteine desulfurase